MIDARQFIRQKLLTICSNVKMAKPDGDVTLPLICYAQVSNVPSDPSTEGLYARISWRIACYAPSFEKLQEMTESVNEMMSGELGFTRTSTTSDDQARIGTDLYLCRMNYSGIVNERSHEVIRKSS